MEGFSVMSRRGKMAVEMVSRACKSVSLEDAEAPSIVMSGVFFVKLLWISFYDVMPSSTFQHIRCYYFVTRQTYICIHIVYIGYVLKLTQGYWELTVPLVKEWLGMQPAQTLFTYARNVNPQVASVKLTNAAIVSIQGEIQKWLKDA